MHGSCRSASASHKEKVVKKILSAMVCGVVAVAFALCAVAAEKAADLAKVKGMVKVTKEGDKVAKIEIVAKEKDAEKAYVVAEGEQSKVIAGLDGKEVEASGTVAEKDGVATLTVKEVKEVKAAAEKK